MAIRYPEENDPVMGSYRPDPNRPGTAPLEPRFANQQLDIERTAATRAGAMQQANQNPDIQAGIQRRQQGATERAAAAQRPTVSAGAVTAFGQMARDGESYRGTAQYPQVQKQPQGALSQNYDWGGGQSNPNRQVRQDLPPVLQSQNFNELGQRVKNMFLMPEDGKGYVSAGSTPRSGASSPDTVAPSGDTPAGGIDYSLLPEQTDPTVLEVNQGRNNGNALTRLSDGRTWTPEDVNFGRDVNTVDMAAGTEGMRQANAIRQQMIDSQNPNRRGGAMGAGQGGFQAQMPSFKDVFGEERQKGKYYSRTAMSSARDQALKQAEINAGIYRNDSGIDSAEAIQSMKVSGDFERALMGEVAAMDRVQEAMKGIPAQALIQEFNNPEATPAGLEYIERLLEEMASEDQDESDPYAYADGLRGRMSSGYAQGGLVRSYAEGGLVEPMTEQESAMLGSMNPMPQQMPPAAVQQYQQYVAGTKAMGIPAVSLEEFMAMQDGAANMAQQQQPQMPQMMEQPQGALAFAEGGMIPDPMDASGSMVVDPDPMAGTDSIPAMIDGQVPAKLDSGEFVLPEDVTRFFGTKKLNDMIQQARSAMQEANAAPGPAM